MAEYIEREAVKDAIGFPKLYFIACWESESLEEVINKIPAADVVEVVRCKECRFAGQDDPFDPIVCGKHSKKWEAAFVEPDGFCSYGERK